MFDFQGLALFCLEKCLSRHKMTVFSKNFRGALAPFPPGYVYGVDMFNTVSYAGNEENTFLGL